MQRIERHTRYKIQILRERQKSKEAQRHRDTALLKTVINIISILKMRAADYDRADWEQMVVEDTHWSARV